VGTSHTAIHHTQGDCLTRGWHKIAQGPPEDFELPEDMQLDGDGGAGQEDSGPEDGQQEGMEADATEDGEQMPETETQERQPKLEAEGDCEAILQASLLTQNESIS
jgi:hypothetical protein